MPYLSVTSNQPLDTGSDQLRMLSRSVAEGLGKPESYVMVALEHNPDMLFAGSAEPLAYCELKSLGLQESQTTELSERICDPKRVYIEFSSPARAMWGWDRRTF